MQVNENGVISFKEPWRYSYPNRFPTSYFFTRRGLCVAPFWSDNDIRRAGTVLYATYDDKVDATTNKAGRRLLTHVNKYIQDRYTDEPFKGCFYHTGTMCTQAHMEKIIQVILIQKSLKR